MISTKDFTETTTQKAENKVSKIMRKESKSPPACSPTHLLA